VLILIVTFIIILEAKGRYLEQKQSLIAVVNYLVGLPLSETISILLHWDDSYTLYGFTLVISIMPISVIFFVKNKIAALASVVKDL